MGQTKRFIIKKTKTNKKPTLFKCDSVYLQIRHPHWLGRSIWILWPFNHTGPRIKPATHTSAKSNPGFLSARKQHFWKLQNPKHCSFIQFLSSSAAFLTPFCVRGNKCGFITHAAQNILSFFPSFYSQRAACNRRPGRRGAPRYWLLIKHRSHSVLIQLLLLLTAAVTQSFSKQHLAGVTSNDLFHKDDQSGSVRFPADFWKGDATFPCIFSYTFKNSIFKKLRLIKLTSPGLGSASMSHHHTYLLHADQPSNWLLKVWPSESSTVLHQNES